MLKNYLKIAYRNLLKNRIFSLINLAGLSLGFTATILIALYVTDELHFDAFHSKAAQIYRVTETTVSENKERHLASTATQVGPAAQENFSEVENFVRLAHLGRLAMGYGEFRDYEPFWMIDSTFFKVFDFTFLAGSPETSLNKPYSVVLTESTKKKYFGDEPALGKTFYTNLFEATVTGVIQDFPTNSHLDMPLLFSSSTGKVVFARYNEQATHDWSSHMFNTYLLLKPGIDPEVLADKLTHLVSTHRQDQDARRRTFALQPLRDIHFYSQHLEEEINAHEGDIQYLYIFGAVGTLILLIAFINYINLSTARATKRAKEVGLRKVVGASKYQLIYQFMGESILLVLLSLVLAITFVQLLFPFFNQLSGKDLQLNILGMDSLLMLLLTALLSGVLAGSYPAFYLARFKPAFVLKQQVSRYGSLSFRRLLVVMQFAVAVMMITATAVVYQQMQYIRHKDLGYNREQLMTVDINSQPMWERYEAIKAAFQQLSAVESVTAISRVPGEWKNIPPVDVRQQGTEISCLYLVADEDFVPTFDIDLLEGRNFRHSQADSAKVLLNETAVQTLGLTNPIGQTIEIISFSHDKLEQPFRAEVIGVVNDFHMESVREKIAPTVISYYLNPLHSIDYYALRIETQDLDKTLAAVEGITKQIDSASPLEYNFLDDKFEEMYVADVKRGQILGIAAILAIAIACMGLFALATFATEQRIREIGIRKVLGANVAHITWLISREFLKLVGIAFLVAAPFAWWAMEYWLREFAYHIDVSAYLLLGAGLITLLIAIITVSFQTIKASLANPVESLRYE